MFLSSQAYRGSFSDPRNGYLIHQLAECLVRGVAIDHHGLITGQAWFVRELTEQSHDVVSSTMHSIHDGMPGSNVDSIMARHIPLTVVFMVLCSTSLSRVVISLHVLSAPAQHCLV